MQELPHGNGSKIILGKIDSSSTTHALSAVDILKSEYGITKLDVVIANAGISNYYGKAVVTPADQMFEHFKINSVSPLLLFQACAPFLDAIVNAKFVVISLGAASLSNMGNLPVKNTTYSKSKAAANFITRKIHFENPNRLSYQPWMAANRC